MKMAAQSSANSRRPSNLRRNKDLLGYARGEHCGQTWYPAYGRPTHDARSGAPTVEQIYICEYCGSHFKGPRFPS